MLRVKVWCGDVHQGEEFAECKSSFEALKTGANASRPCDFSELL